MRVLLIAGLGPHIRSEEVLVGSAFDYNASAESKRDLSRLYVRSGGYPLLRPHRGSENTLFASTPGPYWRPYPHLTTLTLESILRNAGIDFETKATEDFWRPHVVVADPDGPFDAVLLSTTFIWEPRSLAHAIRWIEERFPATPIVVGGQYSNLKYRQIMNTHPSVFAVVLGDAEAALPALLKAIEMRSDLSAIPNLALRDPTRCDIRQTDLRYVDLEQEPSPAVYGRAPVVPYESMRGCPFSCRFCSFPAASPKWRFKSAEKIRDDFSRYRDQNDTRYVRALDSTFTVPPARFRRLLPMLEKLDIRWEAYSRANAISDAETVEALEASGCLSLALGFESMSDKTLALMDKKVGASDNRTASHLLSQSGIDYRVSFIVGYPGEFPVDFGRTRDFLVNEFQGRFTMNVFSLSDETMPVWADAPRTKLEVSDMDDPDADWQHIGMDRTTAFSLRRAALREIRWKNDEAIHNAWQGLFEMPLAPTLSANVNRRIEKLVDRLAMLRTDFPNSVEADERRNCCVESLAALGVSLGPDTSLNGAVPS